MKGLGRAGYRAKFTPTGASDRFGATGDILPQPTSERQQGRMKEEQESAEYLAFVEKFKPKRTTDDCYTPPNVYAAVADWVAARYGLDRARFVRPFWPGGDYESFAYPGGCTVVDNPPFSILSKIVRFYLARKIPFFLFAPGLTCLGNTRVDGVCAIVTDTNVRYENGAEVTTSFLTSLEPGYVARIALDLSDAINRADKENRRASVKTLPKYRYPDAVLHIAPLKYMAAHRTAFDLRRRDCTFIRKIDANASGIFGGGYLLTRRAAAERAAAERAAGERHRLRALAARTGAAEAAGGGREAGVFTPEQPNAPTSRQPQKRPLNDH